MADTKERKNKVKNKVKINNNIKRKHISIKQLLIQWKVRERKQSESEGKA